LGDRSGIGISYSVVPPRAVSVEAAMFSHWPISAWAKSARRRPWESDEFILRRNELLALAVSLLLMATVAMAAFVACAVLQ